MGYDSQVDEEGWGVGGVETTLGALPPHCVTGGK